MSTHEVAADPYSTLGLPWGASRESINRAFRKLALLYHPDRNHGDLEAEARFKLISAAYQRLKESGWYLPPPPASAAPRSEEAERRAPSSTPPSDPSERATAHEANEPKPEAPPPRPVYWPDGRRIHYPTQAEIDALLRESENTVLLPGLRAIHDKIGKAVAQLFVFSTVISLVVIVLLLIFRWIKSW